MFKQIYPTPKLVRAWSFAAITLIVAVSFFAVIGTKPKEATAATNNTVNFQARLMSNTGTIVADGVYNVEFKIYNALTSSGSSQGSCAGDVACLWSETRTSANRVTVANGYLTVDLGSVSSLPTTIDWSENMYLSMRIGGTAVSPTWDPEMSPRLHLTAVPYAFSAAKLRATAGSNTVKLEFASTFAQATTITLPDPGASTAVVCYQTATACGFALSSGSGNYIQNSTSQQTANFNIVSSAAGSVGGLVQAATSATQPALVVKGGATPAAGGDLLQFQNSSSTVLSRFDADGDLLIGVSSADAGSKIEVAGSITSVLASGALRSYLNVVGYDSSLSTVTGTMKITLPQGWNSTMMRMTIKGYNYSSVGAWEVVVGGYNYSGANWINTSAEIRGSAPFNQVRLAYDGANVVVLLGTTSTTWTYPKMMVSEFTSGFTGASATWGTGWSMAPIVSETGITNIATPTISTYISTAGNFGVGTTSPGYKVDVAGDVNISSGSAYRINGASICTSSGCLAAGGSGSYIQNGTAQQAANFFIQNASTTGTHTAVIKQSTSQTGDLLQFRLSDDSVIGQVDATGNLALGTAGSPGARLQVSSASGATRNLAAIFNNPNSGNGAGAQILIGPYTSTVGMSSISAAGYPGGTTATDLWLQPRLTGGALGNGIYISSTDSVGIGTTTTPALLTVAGTLQAAGAATLNGDLTVGDANTDLLTINAVLQGATPLVFEGAGIDAHELSLVIATLTADRTVTFGDETGTVCLQGSASCGFATGTTGSYIQNQNASDQTANMRISGTVRANTSVQTPLLDTATAVALNIGTTNATSINLNKATNVTGNLAVTGTGSFTGAVSTTAGGATGVGNQLFASNTYVQSRAQNLVTNGSGLLGNNYNFSTMAFDSVETYSGGGSFRVNVSQQSRVSDELIPIDPTQTYVLSGYAKSGDTGGANFNAANRQYLGVALADIDGLDINPAFYSKVSGSTDTTLAAPLNPGDTTVTLTSAAGWANGSTISQAHFAWYGYTNAKGYTYPDYTYTRTQSGNYSSNSTLGTWTTGGIVGNVITLRVPWAGPALASGAEVRNNAYGGTYKYISAANVIVPNAWTNYSGFIGGLDVNGTQNSNLFPYGASYVKLLFLINYHAAADNNIRWSNLSFSNLTTRNLELATTTVQGVVSTTTQTFGGNKTFQGSSNSWNLQATNGTVSAGIYNGTLGSFTGAVIGTTTNHSLALTTNGNTTPQVVLLTSGNLGVGTLTPSALLSVGSSSQFQVSSAGAVTAVGVNAGSGLIQGTGGVTISGAGNQLYVSSATSASVNTGTNWMRAPKNAVSLALGDNDSTVAYTANDASSNIRFNGTGVGWGDFGYYPQGGGAGNYGNFRMSIASTTIDTVPDAKLGVGSLYAGTSIGVGSTSPAGMLSVGASNQFQVSSVGAVTAVGVSAGAGLLQGALGLTVTGAVVSLNASSNFATNINTGTSSGTVTIGGGSAPLVIDSTAFDVSVAGALSGITTIATSSTINSQTISSAANFTGTVTIQGGSALTLGTASSTTGSINFKGATGANSITLVGQTNPGGARTITLPDETGTLCIQNSVSCGFLTGSASSYIQNQTAVDQTASLRISGTAQVNTSVTSALINATTGVQTAGVTRLNASGNLVSIGTISASGTIATSAGVLQVAGTGSSYIMGALGLGVTNPQGALTIANNVWITGQSTSGSSINILQINANNEIQLGAALAVDGGIVLPTNGGQLTLVDLPIDATATVGTKQSYTFRVGSSNVFTVYGEADGSGNLQNGRVVVGTSLTPTYTLEVGGDANLSSGSSYRINGTAICTSSGCTPASGSSNYIQNGTSQQTATFNVVSSSASVTTAQIQGAASGTVPVAIIKGGATPTAGADILQLQNSSSSVLLGVNSDGDVSIARSLRINYTSGMTTGLTIQGASGGDFVSVNALNSRFWIGDSSGCGGRFCVNQQINTVGGSAYTNMYNNMPVVVTTASTFVNQEILLSDTSTAVANTLRGMRIDLTGTTNTSATLHGLLIKIPSTTSNSVYAGNSIQVQNGSVNLMKVTNVGATSFQNTLDVTEAFQVLNAAGDPILNVDTSTSRLGVNTESPDQAMTINGNMTIRNADTATKQYRFSTSGATLGMEAAGADMVMSGWTGAAFSGTQVTWLTGSASGRALTVGTGTGSSSTPTILVLDNKTNDETDPANGVNGAMYYNTTAKGFRCYEDGGWRYCNDPRSMSYGYNIREEFVGTDVSAFTGSELGWNEDNSTGADVYRVSAQDKRPGIIQLNSGTTATGHSTYFLGYAADDPTSDTISLSGGETIEFAANIQTLSTGAQEYIIRSGLCDNYSGDCVDGVYFEYDRATSANWRVVTATTSTRSKLTTSTAVATGWTRFKIVVNANGTSVDFYVNGVNVGTRTANIPLGSSNLTDPMFQILKTVGSTSRSFQVDYFNMYNSYTTPR